MLLPSLLRLQWLSRLHIEVAAVGVTAAVGVAGHIPLILPPYSAASSDHCPMLTGASTNTNTNLQSPYCSTMGGLDWADDDLILQAVIHPRITPARAAELGDAQQVMMFAILIPRVTSTVLLWVLSTKAHYCCCLTTAAAFTSSTPHRVVAARPAYLCCSRGWLSASFSCDCSARTSIDFRWCGHRTLRLLSYVYRHHSYTATPSRWRSLHPLAR